MRLLTYKSRIREQRLNPIYDSSKFVWLTEVGAKDTKPACDVVVHETDRFAVLPSVGSLVPGWLLVVPKRPASCFAELHEAERAELPTVLEAIERLYPKSGLRWNLFEHGGQPGSRIGCGVDQAHLHVVPLDFDLCKVSLLRGDVKWMPAPKIERLSTEDARGKEYLFAQTLETSLIGTCAQPTSQWFRRLIAEQIGVPNEWDYRHFPRMEVMSETIEKLAG